MGKILYKNGLQVSVGHLRVPGAEILLWQTFWLNPTTGEPEPRPIYEVLSSHSARKAFAGNMYKNVKDPNLVCALTGHKEGSKAFNRYRKIDEETNRQTMSYLE